MNTSLARHWRSLSTGSPGRRFRDRYYHNQQHKNQHWLGRMLRLVFALAAFVAAILLTVIPGPATPLFFLSGALLAADWLWMARVMDRLEVWLRKVFKPVAKFWLGLPVYGRVLLAITTTSISITASVMVYHLMH